MFNRLFFCVLFISSYHVFSQKDSISIDPRYLEDQLYVGLTYNVFSKTPDNFVQNGFAYGFSGGFIKDIPFNKRRNFGMGIGVGYVFDTYIQNVIVTSDQLSNFNSGFVYEDTYTIKTNNFEFPIEFRWRTSTLEKYKFWRVYTGLNITYVLNSNAIGDRNDELVGLTNTLELEDWQFAYILSAGYGTWNFFLQYSLSPFFKSNTVLNNGDSLRMNSFKLGLKFYLL